MRGILCMLIAGTLALTIENCRDPGTSQPIAVDTTSHLFMIHTDTIGTEGIINCVFMLSDSCIWCGGRFYWYDSAGNADPISYDIAFWNGTKWSYTRSRTEQSLCIFAFDRNDVWVAGGVPCHWNGTTWTSIDLHGVSAGIISGVWGTSSTDMYFASQNGSIYHWDGFSLVQYNRNLATPPPLVDVWGDSLHNVWAVGVTDEVQGRGHVLIRVSDSPGPILPTAITMHNIPDDYAFWSIWFVQGNDPMLAGNMICSMDRSGNVRAVAGLQAWNWNCIRGSASNNIIVVGNEGVVDHFNGLTWQSVSKYDPAVNWRRVSVARDGFAVVALNTRAVLRATRL